jgi:polyphosphate kinase
MPRNLDTRVEMVVPISDPVLRDDVLDALDRAFADDTFSWEMHSDGSWTRRVQQGSEPRDTQRELMLGHAARAAAADG